MTVVQSTVLDKMDRAWEFGFWIKPLGRRRFSIDYVVSAGWYSVNRQGEFTIIWGEQVALGTRVGDNDDRQPPTGDRPTTFTLENGRI